MKKLTYTAILLSIAVLIFIFRSELLAQAQKATTFSYCEYPIEYRIGNVDEEFNISQENFSDFTTQAAKIWNSEYPTPLFVENPDAALSVNLVFDERQRALYELSTKKEIVEAQDQELQSQNIAFEERARILQQKVADLNEEIELWNSQGGAPEEEFNRIISQQRQLAQEIDELNTQAQELNLEISNFNNSVLEANQKVETYNQILDQKPEGGIYDPQRNVIEIYIYEDFESLVHILAHEFGHALGVNHVEDPQSIMHPVVTNAVELSNEDLAELEKFCAPKNKIDETLKILQTQLEQIIN